MPFSLCGIRTFNNMSPSLLLFHLLVEEGFCSAHWIPYNGHCFYLDRSQKTWSDAQKACRKEGGDLVSIRNVEDQSFVISQLGFGMRGTDMKAHPVCHTTENLIICFCCITFSDLLIVTMHSWYKYCHNKKHVNTVPAAASSDELWIGLNDRNTEGLFDWSDHSTVSFTSWEFGKPAASTNAEDCVLIRGEVRNIKWMLLCTHSVSSNCWIESTNTRGK